jgi:hypothetical protein
MQLCSETQYTHLHRQSNAHLRCSWGQAALQRGLVPSHRQLLERNLAWKPRHIRCQPSVQNSRITCIGSPKSEPNLVRIWSTSPTSETSLFQKIHESRLRSLLRNTTPSTAATM